MTDYKAADQRVTKHGDVVNVILKVDADQPAEPDWHISFLGPVVAEPGEVVRVHVQWLRSPEAS